MKLRILPAVLVLMLWSCGPETPDVDRTYEDGLEVILNHFKPYYIEGEPQNLKLEEEFRIDIERKDLLEAGLTTIYDFEIDEKGSIWIQQGRSKAKLLFRFDREGNLKDSFVRSGQGPGEVSLPFGFGLGENGDIFFNDQRRGRLVHLDSKGNLIKELPIKTDIYRIDALGNGKFLFLKFIGMMADEEDEGWKLILSSPDISAQQELDRAAWPSPFSGKKSSAAPHPFLHCFSQHLIFCAHDQDGYQISVFDLEGNPIRKIRKEYRPVSMPEEYKKMHLEQAPENILPLLYFPDHMPPYQYLFADDEDRLYVMTYEQGTAPGEYLYDIFNAEGAFIARMSLGNYADFRPLETRARHGRLYSIRQKDSGFQELVVYRMHWE